MKIMLPIFKIIMLSIFDVYFLFGKIIFHGNESSSSLFHSGP